MNDNITDQIKTIYDSGRKWLQLEIRYAKLTATEKLTVLMSTLILGAICLLLGIAIIILLSFSLADVFKSFMSPAWAYLTVSGVLLILIALIYVFRRTLLENPISRLLSKLILDLKPQDK